MRTTLSKLTKTPQEMKQQKSEISDLNVSKIFTKFDPVLSWLSGTYPSLTPASKGEVFCTFTGPTNIRVPRKDHLGCGLNCLAALHKFSFHNSRWQNEIWMGTVETHERWDKVRFLKRKLSDSTKEPDSANADTINKGMWEQPLSSKGKTAFWSHQSTNILSEFSFP